MAACFFAAVHLGHKPKLEILAIHAIIAAERIFGISDFLYYAIADGIKEILNKSGHGTIRKKEARDCDSQLSSCLTQNFGESPAIKSLENCGIMCGGLKIHRTF